MLTLVPDTANARRFKLLFPDDIARKVWDEAVTHPDALAVNGPARQGIAKSIVSRLMHEAFRLVAPEYKLLKQWPDDAYHLGAGVDPGPPLTIWMSVMFTHDADARKFVRGIWAMRANAI